MGYFKKRVPQLGLHVPCSRCGGKEFIHEARGLGFEFDVRNNFLVLHRPLVWVVGTESILNKRSDY